MPPARAAPRARVLCSSLRGEGPRQVNVVEVTLDRHGLPELLGTVPSGWLPENPVAYTAPDPLVTRHGVCFTIIALRRA